MAIEQQHIITDKTLIRAAKAVSVIFTPFSIPFVAFLILFVFSYLRIMPLQYKLIVLGVVYCFTILMPTRRFGRAETKVCTVHPDHYLLHLLPAHDAPAEYPLVYDRNYFCRSHHDDNLRYCQPEVEAQRTHGRSRRHNRRTGCFQRPVRIQSGGLVVHIHPHRRRVGYGADHPPTPYAGRGNGRFRRRADLLPAGAAPVLQISIPFVQHILILNINS